VVIDVGSIVSPKSVVARIPVDARHLTQVKAIALKFAAKATPGPIAAPQRPMVFASGILAAPTRVNLRYAIMRFLLPEALAVALTYRKAHPCAGFSSLWLRSGYRPRRFGNARARSKSRRTPRYRSRRLPVIGNDSRGLICAGPLGPAPCTEIARWINPSQMSVQAGNVSGALQCAQMTAQNVRVDGDAFLGCTRMALVLDQDSIAVVNCAKLAKGDTSSFGVCAGKALIGSQLSPQQNGVIQCAVQNSDDDDEFASRRGWSAIISPPNRAKFSYARPTTTSTAPSLLTVPGKPCL
jgi:hypothetical protein